MPPQANSRQYIPLTKIEIQDEPSRDLRILYGDCPACSSYVRLVRLREAAGHVELLNLREYPELVTALRTENIEVNEGMIVEIDGKKYHGADAIHVMALLSSPSNAANVINLAIFRNRWAATGLYPALRAGRNALLRFLGRKLIG